MHIKWFTCETYALRVTGYRRGKWEPEFKARTKVFVFHFRTNAYRLRLNNRLGSLCCIATYMYKYKRKHNQKYFTNFNEWTNIFLYEKYIPHTLFSKGLMFLWYVRDEWRQGQTAILTQLLRLTIACCVIFKNPLSTSSASWLGLLNRGSLRPIALRGRSQSANWFSLWPSCQQLTQRPPASAYYFSIRPLASASTSAYLNRWISDWRLDQGSIYNNHPTFFFSKLPPVDIFLTSLSIPLTHTSYKYCSRKKYKKKNGKKNYLNNSKNNTILKQLEGDLFTMYHLPRLIII